MRLGLSTPVVIQQPGVASDWEKDAGPADLAAIAASADTLGFHYLTCSEHVGIPAQAADTRGSAYWDPLATLSFLAAHTEHIRLTTSVLVLGYHHPVALAKSYGTLDRLSGGRAILGVGVGSLREEFDLLGVEWADRGAEADAALRRLRTAWGQPVVDGLAIDPHATTTDLTVWVGGRTLRSLRRAVDLGNGWMPFGLSPDTITEYLARHPVPPGFEVVLSTGRACDPLGDRDGTRRQLERLRAAGATLVTCVVRADGPDHYRDQLRALHEIGDPL